MLEQLKGDGKYLNIDIMKSDASKDMEHDENADKSEQDAEMTLNNKKFSQIAKKLENMRTDIETNESFCFSTMSFLSFIILNSEMFLD